MLDKYRIQRNCEWFEISEDLAIYVIDIVCLFIDGFISNSEQLLNTNIKQNLLNELENIIEEENIEYAAQTRNENGKTTLQNENIEQEIQEMKITQNENNENEEDSDIMFTKFIEEYCEIDKNYSCLHLELLGAYRFWAGKLTTHTRPKFKKYMDKKFLSVRKIVRDYSNTTLSFYTGIKPKSINIKRENEDILPLYEEFILSECKFDYTYRTTKTILMKEFQYWCEKNNKEYKFTKDEKIHYESYLSRNFLNSLKIHINGGCNGYYGLQLKTDMTINVGMALNQRKIVYKVNSLSNTVIEKVKYVN